MDSLTGKRKKQKVECANPLFVQWLTEWKDEATDNGWKTQYTFNKALNTIKRFPLPLSCGKDCRMLQNFGDKICKMLDDRLAKHVETYGTTAPVVRTDNISTSRTVGKTSCSMLDNLAPPRKVHTVPRVDSGIISDESDSEQHIKQRKQRKSSGNKAPREYIPAYRSGSYSILLALHRNAQDPTSLRDFMTRTELIEAAQPLADKSFTVPDLGCRYTAWSSMGTLIKKGLIIKNSSPARYSLTPSGNELAYRLETADGSSLDTSTSNRPSTTNTSQEKSNSPVQHLTDDWDDCLPRLPSLDLPQDDSSHKDKALNTFMQTDGLQYWLVTDENRLVLKDDAAVSIVDTVTQTTKTKPEKQRKNNNVSITSIVPPHTEASLRDRLLGPQRNIASVQYKRGDTFSSLTACNNNTESVLINSQESTASDKTECSDSQISAVSTESTPCSLPQADFVLPADSFDIILLVDNREFYGGGKTNSKTLLPDLIRNGVECDLRPLHVGDMLWIAREKSHNIPGQIRKPQGRELVLDYIVERKRMDDLVSSTIDGRFREQKFRLKRCGVKNAIYLIEDCGSMQHFSISEDKLKQAITNTQVIDGFQIKKTHDVKETVTYLTVLTRYLQSYYRGKTLHACSLDMLQEMRGSFQIQDHEQILVEFQHFNQGSVKSKNLIAREMFGKQLIQLHGMSADKAKAIVDHYPTVMHLFDAFISCRTNKERESLIANIKVGKLGRNLGIGQSRQISQLYWTNTALT